MIVQCFAKNALSDLYDVILPALEEQTPPFPMFVIGSGCSPRAQPVATTINFINMMMVSEVHLQVGFNLLSTYVVVAFESTQCRLFC